MKRITYLIKRIFKMNFKNMREIIKKTALKSGRSKLYVFIDMIYSGIVYQAGYMDYYACEMYNASLKDRKTFMTRGKNDKYIRTLNNREYYHWFLNKDEFNKKFSKYLKRDHTILSNEKNLKKFVKNKEYIICKPRSGSCGKGIEKIKVSEYNIKDLFKHLKDNNLIVLEEVIIQNKVMNKLYPLSVNTVRIVGMYVDNKPNVAIAFVRIGNKGNFVDNFNSGGMTAPVDIETGIINFPAIDKKGNVYEMHPYTKTKIVGFKIPYWEEAIKLVKDASKIQDKVKMVGWDIAFTDEGPLLVEGNEYPGHDIYQLPQHRKDNIGVLPMFEKILKLR